MLKNYFKTAIRSLWRNKNFTFINITGLAVGITVCLLIFSIIRFESSFDNFHTKRDRIYRVLTEYHHADAKEIFYGAGVPRPLPTGLKTSFPEVEKVATIYSEGNDQLQVLNENGQGVKKFKEKKGVLFTEPSFFEIFDFTWLAGKPAALKDPNSAVLTRETAEKYFGDWKLAMGKSIRWNSNTTLKVAGILADIPSNTDFQVKVIISYGTAYTARFASSTNWDGTGSSFNCYILLPEKVSTSSFNTQLKAYAKKMKSADNKDSHIIQPLHDVHFDTKTGNYSGKSISHALINALWVMAAFILLIACVNFINLATAQAVNRSREVGVRKVLGSNKRQLKTQFISETFLVVICAVLLAVVLTIVALPAIKSLLEIQLSAGMLFSTSTVLFLLATTIMVTLLSGFYPSVVLSGFNPINALKSKVSAAKTGGLSLRRGLVVFQFSIALILIIATLVMTKQMNYFTEQPLGFNKDAIVNIPFPGDSVGLSKLEYLHKKLSETAGIQHISFSSNTPVEDDNDNWTTFTFDHAIKETEFYAINKWTDHEYLPTYQLPLVAGRNLQASDTVKEFLVNELLIKNLGITNPQDALNKEISLWDGRLKGNIVGVLKDFNARSFRRDMAPVLLATMKREYNLAGIKIASSDILPAMKSIEKTWQELFPDFVFEYQFLDAKVESFYMQENRLSQLYKIFAGIAIFLSCLGLYGLASFMAVQRIKEVGIRKVLGATTASIIYLFSREFVLLIGIAFIIASPVAWYFMNQWLQDYPYRIVITGWVFIAAIILAIVIALLTVSFQAIKAAVSNPVTALRSE